MLVPERFQINELPIAANPDRRPQLGTCVQNGRGSGSGSGPAQLEALPSRRHHTLPSDSAAVRSGTLTPASELRAKMLACARTRELASIGACLLQCSRVRELAPRRASVQAREHACTFIGVSSPKIVTVAATKGGVGKTTLAYELASCLNAILIDFDWDGGGATRMWGYDPRTYRNAPLLDAFEVGPGGNPPRPRRRPHQPSLVPSSPDLASSRIPDALVADCLTSWATTWASPYVVIDTHPGANPLSDGAMEVADIVVTPVLLGAREMDALSGMLNDYIDYRLLLVPMMVPPSPPRRYVDLLARLADGRPVAPPVSEHRWIRRRVRRSAITLQPNPGVAVARAAAEYRSVARAVEADCE